MNHKERLYRALKSECEANINEALLTMDMCFNNAAAIGEHTSEHFLEEASKSSPLAQAIFNFPFVKEVFISNNYISVTKYDMIEWNEVFAEVRSFIREYLVEGKTIIAALPKASETSETSTAPKIEVKLEGISAQIADILDEYIKPAVAGDGGNIAFNSYDENNKVVSVIFQGACSGCPSSTATLKNGIETLLKEMLPNQINEVVALNG